MESKSDVEAMELPANEFYLYANRMYHESLQAEIAQKHQELIEYSKFLFREFKKCVLANISVGYATYISCRQLSKDDESEILDLASTDLPHFFLRYRNPDTWEINWQTSQPMASENIRTWTRPTFEAL